TAPAYYVGEETLRDRLGATPARAVLDLVEMQPGWLVEANGVLHPRGAEYNTQYVVDGFPVVDNRSPAYAPGLDVDEIQSMNVRTAGYPDPPVEQKFTNNASGGGASAHFATGWDEKDRIRLSVGRRRTGFLVPDERLQFGAGQRQDRRNEETSGQISYQRTLAPWLLG